MSLGRRRRDRLIVAVFAVAVLGVAIGYGGFRWVGKQAQQRHLVTALTRGGDPVRGRGAIVRYGCGGCHTISSIRTANGLVGPPLDGVAGRLYIAGVVPNTPDALMAWIRDPRAVDGKTAMPNTGVTADDARDIAAFLYTLR
ncbi:MAG: c-type cytochrome [Gemmatimonas sp.]